MLEQYLKNDCDLRLPGLLSFSIKEAYNYHEKLLKSNPILREPEMRKAYGHLRQGLVDVSLKWVFEKSEVYSEVINKAAKNNKNGYTFLTVKAEGITILPVKTRTSKHMPRKALHRIEASANPFQLNIFELDNFNEKDNQNENLFLMLTYGGANHQLEFIELGVPDVDNNRWLDKVNIINYPMLLERQSETEMKKGLELTFTETANKLLEDDQSETN